MQQNISLELFTAFPCLRINKAREVFLLRFGAGFVNEINLRKVENILKKHFVQDVLGKEVDTKMRCKGNGNIT